MLAKNRRSLGYCVLFQSDLNIYECFQTMFTLSLMSWIRTLWNVSMCRIPAKYLRPPIKAPLTSHLSLSPVSCFLPLTHSPVPLNYQPPSDSSDQFLPGHHLYSGCCPVPCEGRQLHQHYYSPTETTSNPSEQNIKYHISH